MSPPATDPASWAVLIPSYNHAADLITCLESLRDAEPRPGRVLVIDDASTENAVEEVARWASDSGIEHNIVPTSALSRRMSGSSWLTIAVAPENGGFVRSCNIGLRHLFTCSDAPYVLLFNNDAAVSPSYFAQLATAVTATPEVGLLSGTIYEWDRKTVWYAGARFNPLRALAIHDVEIPRTDGPHDTGYVSGCSMLISRAVLDKVRFLGECFEPCYLEDVDYSLRVSAAGFAVMYAPRAVCYHRVGTSLGRAEQSPRTVYSVVRNRGYAVRRNYPGWRRAMGVTYMAVTKPGRALLELMKGNPGIARAYLSGMITGVFLPIPDRGERG